MTQEQLRTQVERETDLAVAAEIRYGRIPELDLRAAELKALKEAGLRYMAASDALVNALAFGSTRDKSLVDHLARVQSAGNDMVLMADDDLARQTLLLSQHMASLLSPSVKPMDQRLAELNTLLLDWIKQLKRSIDALKTQNEDALGLKASTQVVAQLKR